MKKMIFVFVFCFILTRQITAQVTTEMVLSPADSLRRYGSLFDAIQEFKKIYFKNPADQTNLYNYACALAITKQNDSCFKYLNLTLNMDISRNALIDPDFISLWGDKRWTTFENELIALLEKKNNKKYSDVDYAKHLWKMNALDQAYYQDIEIAENKIGRNSKIVIDLWDFKKQLNDRNLKELEQLIEQKGFPKISQVGGKAASAAFLIIQHSDTEKQKKYLPSIKKLCEEKEANWESYALMYDRVQVADKKPQRYGSQLFFNEQTKQYELFPLLDATKIDEWRKEIGMIPLAEYLSAWGIKFPPNK